MFVRNSIIVLSKWNPGMWCLWGTCQKPVQMALLYVPELVVILFGFATSYRFEPSKAVLSRISSAHTLPTACQIATTMPTNLYNQRDVVWNKMALSCAPCPGNVKPKPSEFELSAYLQAPAHIEILKIPSCAKPTLPDIKLSLIIKSVRDSVRELTADVAALQVQLAGQQAILKRQQFVKEFVRVRLVLADLNDEYGLEMDLRSSGKTLASVKLQYSRLNRSHFLRDYDSPQTKIAKTKYALERLDNLSSEVVEKFGKKYGVDLLPTVLELLHRINLDEVVIDDDVREEADDWWAGLDG